MSTYTKKELLFLIDKIQLEIEEDNKFGKAGKALRQEFINYILTQTDNDYECNSEFVFHTTCLLASLSLKRIKKALVQLETALKKE